MTVLSAVREYIAQCPCISLFSDGAYVDFTTSDAGCYGIMPSGEITLEQDFAGNTLNQYNFVLYARGFTVQDADRVENNGFLEEFARWIQENNRKGIFPVLDRGMAPESISCTNGALFEYDESQMTGLYQIQCQFIYERMV